MSKCVCLDRKGQKVIARTPGQAEMINTIRENDISFVDGPAGTGKTFLAIAMAVAALKENECSKIILVRPAVESGESLGFLPGDIGEKISPYMRPLYDSLEILLDSKTLAQYNNDKIIEIAPLAYMRGRTLERSFIILDEAQNTTLLQMKMFLTRIGQKSKVIVNGDRSQVDLDRRDTSGFQHAQRILTGINGIGMCALKGEDIVRHKILKEIIKAYDKDFGDRSSHL